MTRHFLIFLILLSLCPFSFSQSRRLHWRALSVRAQLDASGALRLEERHAMVFTGDWNGGERVFRRSFGQEFRLESLSRIDPSSGAEIPLMPGDLSAVDQYRWADSNTLRWRSRLPGSAPFDGTEIVYVIRYTLSNILAPEDGGYLLDHDFAFPQRAGVIESFVLALDLDPVWEPLQPFDTAVSAGPLPPGHGYVVTLPLRYQGAGVPAAVHRGAASVFRWVLLAVFAGALAFLLRCFRRREAALGRFVPLVSPQSIDESWLQANILNYPPELAGALWDESVGAPEVAAVLARLVAEGKLASEVRKDVLHLKLLDREGLSGYERDLVDALFVGGGLETDTERVRKHYRKTGFDPSAKIRGPLEARVSEVLGPPAIGAKPSWKAAFILAAAGVALLAIGALGSEVDLVIGIVSAVLVLALYVPAKIMSLFWRKRVVKHLKHFIFMIIPPALPVVLLAFMLLSGLPAAGAWTAAGAVLLCLAAFTSVLNGAKSRQTPAQIEFRKRLAAAREYFRTELARPSPALQDSWYPYLLAFGLGKNVDRWFAAYAAPSAPSKVWTGDHRPSGGAIGRGAGKPSWTGGGGAFGGAGASGSWAAVAGSLAAGVAAPSSSSHGGSGGGGGGGGRSGGGGGGGW